MTEDFYITFLKKIENSPMTWDEIKILYPKEHDAIWLDVRDRGLLIQRRIDGKYILSFDARFKLLEHEELHDARKNAKFASWVAIVSIIISFATMLVSIYYSSRQLGNSSNPIELKANQMEKINNLKFDASPLNEKLDIIIKNQDNIIKKWEILGIKK